MPTILIADDHPLFREALVAAVAASFEARLLYASTLDELRAMLTGHPEVTLVILDLKMPDCGLFAGVSMLRRGWPHVPLLVISALSGENVVAEVAEHGAVGFIAKSSSTDEIIQAVGNVLAGRTHFPPAYTHRLLSSDVGDGDNLMKRFDSLTIQQCRVLQLMSMGQVNKQIAFELSITERTVKAHVSGILHKFGVSTRTQAVIVARRLEEFGIFE